MWHSLGGATFIERTKFKESNRYVVFDKGQRIDSKPLLAMAYQLQFACSKEAVPRLSGGDETRAILQRLGYTLVDLRSETSPPFNEVMQVDSSTNFWWANQSQNFDPVFEDRTLWAPLVGKNGQRVDHWLSLEKANVDDIVFHYNSPELRAVSRVATVPQLAYPPRGYLESSTKTVGNLVLVDPVREVQVGRSEVLEELESGFGPVTADGTLRRGYFFPVSKAAGLAVLRLAGLKPVEKVQDTSAEASPQLIQRSSSRLALTAVRAEQGFLRRQQIRRWGSVCCLCGSSLPEELLVAAHIKPRWACTEEERMDTFNIAMLACLFGCDALYELGYVLVGRDGTVERGIRHSSNLEERLEGLLNRRCLSFTDDSRNYFEWHRSYHMSRTQPV
ncbi:hypothetical protein ARTHROSP310_35140 [Arthrobacter sp. AD-310]